MDNFPRKIKIDNQEIYDPAIIANSFNTYFTNIGSNLATKIPHSEKHFTEYLYQAEVETEKELTIEEFESAFKTLKMNKENGFDDVNSNIVKAVQKELSIFMHKVKNNNIHDVFQDSFTLSSNEYNKEIIRKHSLNQCLEQSLDRKAYRSVDQNYGMKLYHWNFRTFPLMNLR